MVVSIKQFRLGRNQHHFGGGGACVDAKIRISLIGFQITRGNGAPPVADLKRLVVRLCLEQGEHGVHGRGLIRRLLQHGKEPLKGGGRMVLRAQRRADGGVAVSVLREDSMVGIQVKGLHKAGTQSLEEVKGAAQKDQLACELPALGEATHGLIHHSLKNGGGDVLLSPALIQDGLHIALGEDAAAGSNGINFFMPQGERVQLAGGHIQQGGHLIDKRAGSTGTRAVHPFLQGIPEEDDFGVLAPQLNDGVGVWDEGSDSGGGGVNLLNKSNPARFGNAQPRGTGNQKPYLLTIQHVANGLQRLTGAFAGFGVMALIRTKKQLILSIQNDHLHGGRSNVNSNSQRHDDTSGFFQQSWLLRTTLRHS